MSMTQLLRSGPPGTKRNLAVVGDGFAVGDQAAYNELVSKVLMGEVFRRDYFYEDAQAFNVYRVNLISTESGVTRHTYDDDGVRTGTTSKNTALDTIFTARWDRCWIEDGPNTDTRLRAALRTWAPDWDFVLVILNEPGFGGCRRGNRLYVTGGAGWAVQAHEFGHGFGSLADEYCRPGTHSGPEPGAVNITANTNRATLKWRRFIRPATPVPTGVSTNPGSGQCTGYNQGTRPSGWNSDQDVGLFEGAQYVDRGRYRPVENCRMLGNTPRFCPVCYTELKRIHHPLTGRTFESVYTGDLNGDGRDDVLVHTGNSIQIYRSNGRDLDLVFSAVERVPGSWQFAPGDRFFIGDVNGDGKDEVAIYNSTNWDRPYLGLLSDDGANGLRLVRRYEKSIPGWQFARDDQFHLADFNGDGRRDLIVWNGRDWSTPYLGMLRSNGTSFTVARRYDGVLAGWQMRRGDTLYVADFDGNGRDDLFVWNGTDWSTRYLAMLRSTGTSYTMVRRYDNSLPGWQMAAGDRHYVGDFDGDGRDDLYVFNGNNWNMAYLAMIRSNAASLSTVRRYDGNAPGWQMRRNDQHWVGNIAGDGRADLFVYNHQDWSTQYLGTMRSTGSALTCAYREGSVGEWNLGSVDRFVPCNYEGVGGKRNLIVHNRNWLGMIRATPTLSLHRIYHQWVHNYRHGRNW